MRKRMEQIINKIKQEINSDIENGIVPESVKSFSELHDFVDANVYAPNLTENLSINELAEIQDVIDRWLKNGR